MCKHVVVKIFQERKEIDEFTGRYGLQNKKGRVINKKHIEIDFCFTL